MRTYLAAFFVALVVSGVATPFVAWLAHRFGWLDQPSEARKIHVRAVPRLGGVAVVLAFFAPLLGLAVWENRVSNLLYSDFRLVAGLFGGAAAIVALGVYDDLRGASAKLKLSVQVCTAVALWLVGFRIELLGNPLGDAFDLGWLSLPLTTLWIVGVVNAMNLIDGLDGLASGVALLATVVLFGVAFVDAAALLCLITVALAGSLVGFLFWNFNPAKIFLGDSGSMFLGFVLSAVSIWTQQKGATAVALLIPVLALGLPILDTTLSVLRRVRRGQSPFRADREHMHHRLLDLGHSHRNAVLTLYTFSGVFALGALALLDTDATRRAIALSTVVAVAIILLRRIGVFAQPESLPSPDRDVVRRVATSVRSAVRADEAWNRLVPVLSGLGARAVRLTWVQEDRAPADERRAAVFYWRSNPDAEWPLDRAEAHPHARVVPLVHGSRNLGELVFVFRRGFDPKRDLNLAVILELLAESLIEYRTACVSADAGEVVDFAAARRSHMGAR